MIINSRKFLDLYFAIMAENEIFSINVQDITEVIRVLYSSSEFEPFVKKLEIEGLSGADIEDHPFFESIDEENLIANFSVTEKEKREILSRDFRDTKALSGAIEKRAMAKYVENVSNGKVSLKYDDPSGTYRLSYLNKINDKLETNIFTDGDITHDELDEDDSTYDATRIVKVENATYTIVVNNVNERPKNIQIRAVCDSGLIFVCFDAFELLKGAKHPYRSIDKEKPKSYVITKN